MEVLHGGTANEQGEKSLESFLADLVRPHDTANNIASSSAMPTSIPVEVKQEASDSQARRKKVEIQELELYLSRYTKTVHKDSDRKGEQLTSRIWAYHLHIQLCQLHQRTSRVIAAFWTGIDAPGGCPFIGTTTTFMTQQTVEYGRG